MVPIKYNVRNLIVRKTTTIAAAGGLALVVFVFATVLMLGNGIKKAFGRSADPTVAIVLRKGSDNEMSSGLDESNVNLIGAQATAINSAPLTAEERLSAPPHPVTDGPVAIGEVLVVIILEKLGTTGISNITVRGVPEDVMKFRPTAKIVDGVMPKPGSDEVLIGAGLRGRFQGMELGKTFELKKNRPVKVVGVFEDEGSSFESEVWADIHGARQAFGREGYVSSVRVRLTSGRRFDAFKAAVEQNRQLGLLVMRESDYYEKQSEMTANFLQGLGIMIAVFFSLGAMIGAMITMHAQVANRAREIGTLRALGFSKGSVLFSFLLESLVLAFLGGAVGAAASLAMQFVKITTLNANTWAEIVFTFEPTPAILLRSMILAGFMGIVGGFLPALRAARISPVEAMRGA